MDLGGLEDWADDRADGWEDKWCSKPRQRWRQRPKARIKGVGDRTNNNQQPSRRSPSLRLERRLWLVRCRQGSARRYRDFMGRVCHNWGLFYDPDTGGGERYPIKNRIPRAVARWAAHLLWLIGISAFITEHISSGLTVSTNCSEKVFQIFLLALAFSLFATFAAADVYCSVTFAVFYPFFPSLKRGSIPFLASSSNSTHSSRSLFSFCLELTASSLRNFFPVY